ncbi:MAG: cation-transporting P-type ATPase, partial [Clostridia bacterium]|nr:cation-transporting P-type ATPase [Clostridia bacterium]
LTQNAMTVRAAYADGVHHDAANQPLPAAGAVREALVAASLCNNAPLPLPEGRGPGDPTEVALVAAAAAAGLDPAGLRRAHPRLEEVPFDSERRLMTVVCRSPSGERVAYVKGAADAVLARCRTVLRGGREVPLRGAERDAILAAKEEVARRGLRVLAAAGRRLPGDGRVPAAEAESDLVFYGLLGLMDPPRPEVPAAVRTARQAGVEVVLITGDHARTAEAVASEIGILRPGDTVATGADLDAWDDAELARRVPSARVYARVTPAHKLRIVRAWRRRGAVVAMTGDGVNDAPAVREADIGVAMGLTGTDVTREAAAIVLTDDNFASIVAAVEEGRTIYANIRKFVRYLLACNAGEVLVMFLAALLGMPLPLLPVQILFVNLVTDGLPAIALGVDPPEPGVMRRPPRDPNESLFAHGLGWRILRRGAAVGLVCLAVFAVVLAVDNDLDAARTATTLALVLCQLWHAFECRQEGREPVPASAPLNRALVWAVLSSLAATLAILYVPVLQSLFRTTPLGLVDWLVAAAGTVLFGALGRFDGVWTVRAAVGSGSPLRTTGR